MLETKFTTVQLDGATDDGRFSGYASLFGVTDDSGDVVEAGAFAASLARRPASSVKLLYQHDPREPIGRWDSVAEDARGLRVSGRLLTGIARGREVLTLMRAGVLDGLSIGYRTVRAAPGEGRGRRLLEVDLWEISIVTFPMLAGARTTLPLPANGDPADPVFLEALSDAARVLAG